MAKKIILILFLALPAFAFQLKTEEIGMDLPSPWTCSLDSEMWVCEESTGGRQKPAIILVQTRKALVKETLTYFKQQLQNPKSIKGKTGPLLSRVVSLQERNINGQLFFEAIHQEGELDGYFTQYLAARRGDYAYLITMSANRPKWDHYRPIFAQISSSIQALVSSVPTQNMAAGPRSAAQPPVANSMNSKRSLSILNKPLSSSAPGVTPFRLILFFGVCAIAYLVLYAIRK